MQFLLCMAAAPVSTHESTRDIKGPSPTLLANIFSTSCAMPPVASKSPDPEDDALPPDENVLSSASRSPEHIFTLVGASSSYKNVKDERHISPIPHSDRRHGSIILSVCGFARFRALSYGNAVSHLLDSWTPFWWALSFAKLPFDQMRKLIYSPLPINYQI